MRVLLPDPDGPMIAVNSAVSRSTSTASVQPLACRLLHKPWTVPVAAALICSGYSVGRVVMWIGRSGGVPPHWRGTDRDGHTSCTALTALAPSATFGRDAGDGAPQCAQRLLERDQFCLCWVVLQDLGNPRGRSAAVGSECCHYTPQHQRVKPHLNSAFCSKPTPGRSARFGSQQL